MIQFVVSRSDVVEHRTHEIFVSHIIYVNSQRTTDNSLCPYFYNCLFFVESNPQAASMSCPRDALIVAMMPLSLSLSRKRSMSSIVGL